MVTVEVVSSSDKFAFIYLAVSILDIIFIIFNGDIIDIFIRFILVFELT